MPPCLEVVKEPVLLITAAILLASFDYGAETLSPEPETETPNISVSLDFHQCVQICIFFKTEICTESVFRFSRQYCQSVEQI